MRLVEQESHDDCMAACLSMLTDMSLAEVKAEYDMPMGSPDMYERLRDDYTVQPLDIDKGTVTQLSTLDVTMVAAFDSPGIEGELHAVVLHEGELYDPQKYWSDLDELVRSESDVGFVFGLSRTTERN